MPPSFNKPLSHEFPRHQSPVSSQNWHKPCQYLTTCSHASILFQQIKLPSGAVIRKFRITDFLYSSPSLNICRKFGISEFPRNCFFNQFLFCVNIFYMLIHSCPNYVILTLSNAKGKNLICRDSSALRASE